MKVVQELLRHASIRITMDVYTQAMTPGQACGAKQGGGDVTSGIAGTGWPGREKVDMMYPKMSTEITRQIL